MKYEYGIANGRYDMRRIFFTRIPTSSCVTVRNALCDRFAWCGGCHSMPHITPHERYPSYWQLYSFAMLREEWKMKISYFGNTIIKLSIQMNIKIHNNLWAIRVKNLRISMEILNLSSKMRNVMPVLVVRLAARKMKPHAKRSDAMQCILFGLLLMKPKIRRIYTYFFILFHILHVCVR